uniref:Uncharacterized protein n=1 Tax=Romanomermis culicivorax TaxID=13658 RepID=A0A915KU82_ROMCU
MDLHVRFWSAKDNKVATQYGSDVFAKKFCAHRWVENVSV